MKIILTQDVLRLGYQGDLLEVKDGYARNYLIPKGFAQRATRGTLKQYEHLRRAREERETRLREEAHETVERLATTLLRVTARAGETGRLYGSVTTADIARAIEEQLGVYVDRRKIELLGPIRVLGDHRARVALYPDIAIEVKIVVTSTAEGAVTPPADAAAADEPAGESPPASAAAADRAADTEPAAEAPR